jgi:predicted nuclease with TOPRIM domain
LRSKSLRTNLITPHYNGLTPLCETCDSLKGKLFYATKENTKLEQEVAYLTSHLERTIMSEKMIEDDLSQVEESATKSTYKLGVSFERCEDKGEKRAPKFVPTSNYHKEEEIIKSTKTHYPSTPKLSHSKILISECEPFFPQET